MRTIASVVPHRSGTLRRRTAWLVPVAVVAVVAGVVVAVDAPASDAVPSLPARTAAQLLTAVETHAASTQLSGEVRETADLGFPSLPEQSTPASLSWQDFLTGSHSVRVWIDGPTRQRFALLGELSEADVTHNGADVWTYTSSTNTVTDERLPDRAGQSDRVPAVTPGQVADRLLAAVRPTTAVTVDTAQRVAGRAAYTLVLRPKQAGSTVRRVRIAIDAATFVPLQLQVFGSGSSPAVQIGFTSVSFRRPAASVFRFTVPRGATVTNGAPSAGASHLPRRYARYGPRGGHRVHTMPATATGGAATVSRPQVIGSGWLTVLELRSGFDQLAASTGGLLDKLTTPVGTSGERLLHTALINAVVMPDGRAFVGAVTPAELEHVAATH